MASFSTIILLALSDGLAFSGKHISYENLYESKFGLSDGSIRVTMQRLYDCGFIQKLIKNGKAYFRLTSAGTRYLEDLFSPQTKEKWDEKWRVILTVRDFNFDKNTVGMLQTGVYVSPFVVKEKDSSVLVFETKQLGSLSHKEAAERVWNLRPLAERFGAWMKQANSFRESRRALTNLIFQYESLIGAVPRLPLPLFPSGWPEDNARRACMKLVEKHLKMS